jgi:tRNA/rRNA methyltransferase
VSTPHYNQLLLSPAQRDLIEVVLVSPRNPLNIGAVARAMANFGFERLSVVAPYAPHWREAKSAVGAPELLQQARETATLAEAVSQCAFVIGTGTLTHRKPDQPVVTLPEIAMHLQAALRQRGRIALVLGPEKHGLTRDDLSYCHVLLEIPTDPRQPSMNLGQAAAVCLYEIACRSWEVEDDSQGEVCEFPPFDQTAAETMERGAPSALLDRAADLIEETMIAAHYSPESMQAANRYDVRVMLRRMNLSALDARRIMGLFRRILRSLQAPRN